MPAELNATRLRISANTEKATASGRNSDGAASTPNSAHTTPRMPVTAPAPDALRTGFFFGPLSTGAGDAGAARAVERAPPEADETPVEGGTSLFSMTAPN